MRRIAQRCSILLPVIIGGLLIGLTITSVVAVAGQFGPQIWPGKTIKIYSRSSWNQSVPDGINGINQVGLPIKLVLVTDPKQAQVVIYDSKHFDDGCAGGGVVGCAPEGHRQHSWVQLIPKSKNEEDNGDRAPLVMHELGHVLGLGHRGGGCKLMNPVMCERRALNQVDAGCPVNDRFGLDRTEWCSGEAKVYTMCRPTLEAAIQLISMYGGHLPKRYNPWCSHNMTRSWLLDCAYPGWHSQHNRYPVPLNQAHTACRAGSPSFGWQGLGVAQKAARDSYLRAARLKAQLLSGQILNEIYRLDRLAKDCPRRYCFSPLEKRAPGDSQLRYQINKQLLQGIDLGD